MAKSTLSAMRTRSKANGKRPRDNENDYDHPESRPARKKAWSSSSDDESASSSPSSPIDLKKPGLLLPIPRSPSRNRPAQVQELARAKLEILELRLCLEDERKRSSHREMQAKQSMFLDILQEREKYKELEAAMQRDRREMARIQYRISEMAQRHKEELQAEKCKHMALYKEREEYRRESEHQQELFATLHEDLQELKRLHNEERAAQRNYRLGLPPAYGSLDEEDQQPPWGLHTDAGAHDIVFAVDLGRCMIEKDIREAREAFKPRRGDFDAGPDLFVALLYSLSEHCWSRIRNWLCVASSFTNAVSAHLDHRHLLVDRGVRRNREHRTNTSLVAQRLLELVLESLTRILAVLELHPCSIVLAPLQRHQVGLSVRNIDDTLLDCFRKMFDFDEDRLVELQFYLTQLNMIHDRINLVWPRPDSDVLLDESANWLSENVEKERQLDGRSTTST